MEKNENGLSAILPDCNTVKGMHQLAMVYSPMQCFRMLYSPEDALKRGTLFEELDKPLLEDR